MNVVVVGGGLAGLASSIFLARAGRRVTLIERASSLGGRAATHERGGFRFNVGAHALYRGGEAERVLHELGVAWRGASPTPGGYAIDGDALRTLPVGPLSIMTTLLMSFGGKIELAKLLGRLGKFDPRAHADVSTRAFLDAHVASTEARRVLAPIARVATYAADHDALSADVFITQLQLAARFNVVYLDGGWITLVEAMEAAATKAGVRFFTNARAEGVATEGGVIRGVRVDGETLAADAVILATPPRSAAALVPSSRALARAADDAVPILATCLDLALSHLPKPRVRFALGVDRPVYYSLHSATAGSLAPEGGALVHTAYYRRGDEDDDAALAELEAMMEKLQPGYRAHVVERRVLPRITVSNALPRARAGGLAGRASIEVSDVRGLFLAGDWVGKEGHLADASLSSAQAAARRIDRQFASTRASDEAPSTTRALAS